ncbi:hypothetical protein LZ31DRAFT_347730 [Colletotrichum somersetense]|nr:hypothetical protein LZ31DRAFT_347730 [Colletotrichum somersetense]
MESTQDARIACCTLFGLLDPVAASMATPTMHRGPFSFAYRHHFLCQEHTVTPSTSKLRISVHGFWVIIGRAPHCCFRVNIFCVCTVVGLAWVFLLGFGFLAVHVFFSSPLGARLGTAVVCRYSNILFSIFLFLRSLFREKDAHVLTWPEQGASMARCDESISTRADGSAGAGRTREIPFYDIRTCDGPMTTKKDERRDEETDEAKGDNEVGNENNRVVNDASEHDRLGRVLHQPLSGGLFYFISFVDVALPCLTAPENTLPVTVRSRDFSVWRRISLDLVYSLSLRHLARRNGRKGGKGAREK